MYCHSCGKEIADNSNFCRYCGAKQEVTQLSNSEESTKVKAKPSLKAYKDRIDFIQRTKLPKKQSENQESNVRKRGSYKGRKPQEATHFAILIAVGYLVYFLTIGTEPLEVTAEKYAMIYLGLFLLRIMIIIWVYGIAGRLNRNKGLWAVFAFFTPTIALFVIGQQRPKVDGV